MSREYTKEEIWKLYEKLPQELQETIFSEETADYIGNICERNNIEDDKVSEVARLTGRVLLGLLPPNDFEEVLKQGLGLTPEVARKVNQEIFRFIFFPVKNLLEEIYRVETTAPAKPAILFGKEIEEETKQEEVKKEIGEEEIKKWENESSEEKKEESEEDVYREPIE